MLALRMNSAAMIEIETTTDAVLGGRLVLRQPKRGHRAGHDAILLAAATPARGSDRVVEFGAGVGTAGLAVAQRVAGIDLVLVEINPTLAALAWENTKANGLSATVHALDVGADAAHFLDADLGPDSADVVLMNPPFNDAARQRAPDDASKQRAHMASRNTLDVWTHAARRVLKSGGVLTMIWRADGLADVLAALGRGYGSLVLLPVHPDPASPAIRVLIRAIKGGRAPLRLLPALMLDPSGRLADNVLKGRALLSLAEL